MSFVWLTKESSTVLPGQMNKIATETLITNAGASRGKKTDGRRMTWKCMGGKVSKNCDLVPKHTLFKLGQKKIKSKYR